jgi:hypothetical protein
MTTDVDYGHEKVVRLIVLALVGLAFADLALIAALLLTDREVPGELWQAGAAAAAALATMLVNTGTKTFGPQRVEVVNTAEDPVPVDPEDGAGDLRLVTVIALGIVVGFVLLEVLRRLL